MNTKTCTNCKLEKLIDQFYYNSHKKKLESVCKECGKIRCKEWRKNHPQKAKDSWSLSRVKRAKENPLDYNLSKLISSMRCRYPNKEIEKTLTITELKTIYTNQNGNCFYTGIQMKLSSENNRNLFLMSIDRIDSTKGYTKDNVVLCCWGVNVFKGQHSTNDFFRALKSFYTGAKSIGKI